MEKSIDSSKKFGAVKSKVPVKPKPPSGQYVTEGKKLPTKKKPAAKKPVKKVVKKVVKETVKKAPVKKKAGRKPQIDKVLEKLKKHQIHLIPIFNIEMLTTVAGVCLRTLNKYLETGKKEEDEGIEPWDGRRRKGSKFVSFLHIIRKGQNNAALNASLTIANAVEQRNNPQYAFKYMAIRFPELWAEKVRLEHSGKIDSTVSIGIPELHKLAQEVNNAKPEK